PLPPISRSRAARLDPIANPQREIPSHEVAIDASPHDKDARFGARLSACRGPGFGSCGARVGARPCRLGALAKVVVITVARLVVPTVQAVGVEVALRGGDRWNRCQTRANDG